MARRMTNKEIADHLREMAVFYAMDEVPYKPAAYERAASGIEGAAEDVAGMYEDGGKPALKTIDGVGEGLAAHIAHLLEKGDFPEHARFRKKYPFDVLGLTSLEGVGPKTALKLYRELKVRTVKDLEHAIKKGDTAGIRGLGGMTAKRSAPPEKEPTRHLLGSILPLAGSIVDALRAVPGVDHVEVTGSVRRRQETVGDLDFIATGKRPEKIVAAFTTLPQVVEVMEHGKNMAMVRLKNGMHADIRVTPNDSFGAVLLHFTGDKEHNIALRRLAMEKGLKLNEFGLWRGKKRLASRTETEIYQALGLRLMPPEIRTMTGELEAARKGTLPDLIPYGAVRGDLQVQTSWTDGHSSIERMAEEAIKHGLEYIAITDHTKTLAFIHGLDEKKQAAQAKEIDAVNASLRERKEKLTVLKGAEVNILEDGKLDIKDAALAKLDVVGIAVHSHFKFSEEEQTERIIRAMKNPHTDILFHPTGRKLNKRPPYALNMEKVLKAAKATGTAVEIDGYPDRSDLRDVHVRMAVDLGVKLTIDTDAHHPSHFAWLENGTAIARRGWATKKDVLNTRKLPDLLKWLRTPKEKRK